MFDAVLLFMAFAFAFLAVMMIMPPAIRLAVRLRFTDQPGGRKEHEWPVPPIGGIVLFPVYMLVALFSGSDLAHFWPLYAALVLILLTGALDDYRHIDAWVKFGMQFLCALLVVLTGGARIYQLGDIFGLGPLGLSFMSIPFSLAAVMLLINSINLMDGLDGLAGGKSFIALFWLVLAAGMAGDLGAVNAIMPLMGALAGFLFYNMRHPLGRRRAAVFLGDAGSMGLGLVLAWFCISLAQDPDPVLVPISIAWIVALPVIDACGQFYRRVKEGKHPFSADRGHFHYHLIHAGLPVGQSTAIILLIGFVLGAIGYFWVAFGLPPWIITYAWIALLISHIWLTRTPQKYIDFFAQFADEGEAEAKAVRKRNK